LRFMETLRLRILRRSGLPGVVAQALSPANRVVWASTTGC
jgi:hypothetical protein